MKLAVIIVNYGTPDHVLKNLSALVPQLREMDGSAQCWIVDNNSPDNSVEIISKAIETNEYQDLVTLVAHSLNAGFGAGNNVAIRKALNSDNPPDYFYFLNPDAEVMSGTIHEMTTYLEKNKSVGVVGGPILTPEGELECGPFRLPSLRSTIEENLGIGVISRMWKNYRISISPEPEINTSVGWVGGASMMIRRQVLEKTGLFDEGYFLYFEEMDLCKRISDNGYEIYYLPNAKVIHDSGAATGIHNENVRLPEYWHNSRSRYYRKAFGEKGLYFHNIATIVAGQIGRFYGKLRGRKPSRRHFIEDIIKYNFRNNNAKPGSMITRNKDIKLTPNSILAKRPHFKNKDNKLFFMASQNPFRSLCKTEQRLWDAFDKDIKYSKLRDDIDKDIENIITAFIDDGIFDVFEPLTNNNREKVLIFEPHSDDAALSIGGTMWQRRDECEFHLYTLGSTSNYTSYFSSTYGPLDVEEITALRNTEDAIFMRYIGGQHIPTGQNEATLRYKDGNWAWDFLKSNRISIAAFNNHFGNDDERRAWHTVVSDILHKNSDATEIWIPMGVGTHTDHGITRDACLTALKGLKSLPKIMMYQDVPYDAQFKEHKLSIINILEKNGALLEHEPIEVSPVFADKLNLLKVFGSQFKLKAIQDAVKNSALPAHAAGLYEHFWQLNKLPEKFSPVELYYGADVIKAGSSKTKGWLSRIKTAKKIRIILLMPSGQWKEHISFLLKKYPSSDFVVHYSISCKAEILSYTNPRIEYKFLPSDNKSWIMTMVQLLFSTSCPLLFISGEKRYSLASKIAFCYLQHDSIVFDTMENFYLSATCDFEQ